MEVEEALSLVLAHALTRQPARLPLSEALGRVLAADVASDIDSPPHRKALMDGYAVRAADVAPGCELAVIEEVTAGQVPQLPLSAGQATRIMTGAPLPDGADAVAIVEQSEKSGSPEAPRVRLLTEHLKPGQNVLPQAALVRRGETVLRQGRLLRAIELGLLAEVGCSSVPAIPAPRVAVLATGDELVDASQTPAAGQIRNSNSPMLAALVRQVGASAADLGVARDRLPELVAGIEAGLTHDVLLLSGGVSAGVLDLVPTALAQAGVRQVFHKVRIKPGKPIWFGVQGDGAAPKLVFALPGNPVSCLVCFELFVRPALAKMAGLAEPHSPSTAARLSQQFQHKGDRPTWHPARLTCDGEAWQATPLAWKGSADLRTLCDADALIHFPPGDRLFAVGETVNVRRLPELA